MTNFDASCMVPAEETERTLENDRMDQTDEIMDRLAKELLEELRTLEKTKDPQERCVRSEIIANLSTPVLSMVEMATMAAPGMELDEELFDER